MILPARWTMRVQEPMAKVLPTALPPTVRPATSADISSEISWGAPKFPFASTWDAMVGDTAADIANDVVADRADPLGIAQKANGLLRAGNLPGSHGMKGRFIGGGHRHTHDVKQNAHQNNEHQDHKRHRDAADGHDLIRQEGDRAGDRDGHKKYGDDPSDRLVLFLF